MLEFVRDWAKSFPLGNAARNASVCFNGIDVSEINKDGKLKDAISPQDGRVPSTLYEGASSVSSDGRLVSRQNQFIAMDVALILLFASLSFMLALGNTHFWDQDEGFYAATALEMQKRQDWLVPTFNQELFAHKPPLMFWGIRLGYEIFGVGELGARFFSAVSGVLTAVLVYAIATRLFDRFVGILAGIAMSTNVMFCVVARSATADAYLTLFVTAALGVWFGWYPRTTSHLQSTVARLQSIPAHCWMLSYVCMGLAVLTKGPIGFAFPVTILCVAFWLEALLAESTASSNQGWKHKLSNQAAFLTAALSPAFLVRLALSLRLHWGTLIVLLVAAPWFVAVDLKSEGAFLREFIGVHHLGRFSNAMDNHSGPIYYYVLACLLGTYPWSGFAIPVALLWIRTLLHSDRKHDLWRSVLWLSVWFGVYLVVFSMAKTKLPNYVLPAYPVILIAIAYYLRQAFLADFVWLLWQRIAYWCFGAIGLGIVLLPWLTAQIPATKPFIERFTESVPNAESVLLSVSLTGVPLLLIGIMGITVGSGLGRGSGLGHLVKPCRQSVMPAAMCVGALLFVTHLSYSLAPKLDLIQSPQILVQRNRASIANEFSSDSPAPLALSVVSMFRPTLVYYAGGRVEFVGRESFIEQAHRYEEEKEPRVCLLQESDWLAMQSQLPDTWQVLDSATNFPKAGHLLVVGNPDWFARTE